MDYVYITFRSVTAAQRGERALTTGGIRNKLQRTPRWMEEQGCGYCLLVRPEDRGEALSRLQRLSVPYRRCYVPGQNGKLEALP